MSKHRPTKKYSTLFERMIRAVIRLNGVQHAKAARIGCHFERWQQKQSWAHTYETDFK